jgi:hypothetical protein
MHIFYPPSSENHTQTNVQTTASHQRWQYDHLVKVFVGLVGQL